MVLRRNANCGNIYNVMISAWLFSLKILTGRVKVRLLDKALSFFSFFFLTIVQVINVLRGIIRSEMVEANVIIKSIQRMNLDLVLIWTCILTTQEDEFLSLKGDPRVI